MKLKLALAFAAISMAAQPSFAQQFQLNYAVPSVKPTTTSPSAGWEKADTVYGDWQNSGSATDCSNWSPSTSTIANGLAFKQTATDCQQKQTRSAQDYKKNKANGELVASGSQYNETRSIASTADRDAIGILESWLAFDPTYTSWVDTNALYGCTEWSPNPSTYSATTTFTQNGVCKTDQERQRQDREQEKFSSQVRNIGTPVVEAQTLANQAATRPYSVTLGAWQTTGTPYGCTNWAPAASTIFLNTSFTQTATDCSVDQQRTRAESYVDHKTGSTVTVNAANETKVLTAQTTTRTALGTMADDCRFSTVSTTKNYWQEYRSASNSPYLQIWFDNVRIVNDASVGTKVVGGYTYTRGTLVSSSGTGIGYIAKYYICRK